MPMTDFDSLKIEKTVVIPSLGPLPPNRDTRSLCQTMTQTQFGLHPTQPVKYMILAE